MFVSSKCEQIRYLIYSIKLQQLDYQLKNFPRVVVFKKKEWYFVWMAWLREIGSKSVSLTPKAWDLVSMGEGTFTRPFWSFLELHVSQTRNFSSSKVHFPHVPRSGSLLRFGLRFFRSNQQTLVLSCFGYFILKLYYNNTNAMFTEQEKWLKKS